MRKRKLTMQVARAISGDGGRITAWIALDEGVRCLMGIKIVACLDTVRLGGANVDKACT